MYTESFTAPLIRPKDLEREGKSNDLLINLYNMTNLHFIAPLGGELARFSLEWRYHLELSKHGTRTARTICMIKKNGAPFIEESIVKSKKDVHVKELARKYSLRKAVSNIADKSTRTAIWQAYHGRFNTVSVEPAQQTV